MSPWIQLSSLRGRWSRPHGSLRGQLSAFLRKELGIPGGLPSGVAMAAAAQELSAGASRRGASCSFHIPSSWERDQGEGNQSMMLREGSSSEAEQDSIKGGPGRPYNLQPGPLPKISAPPVHCWRGLNTGVTFLRWGWELITASLSSGAFKTYMPFDSVISFFWLILSNNLKYG